MPNVGGVVAMMRALLRHARSTWLAPAPRWVALGSPGIPLEFATDEGYRVVTVPLSAQTREGYIRFKEAIWRSFHGPRGLERLAISDYQAFVEYNHATAQRLLEAVDDFDLLFINDFQQILAGGLIGAEAPSLLQWHIPLEFRGYPEPVRRFFLKSLEGFDAIVVSTRAGLEELLRRGFHGRAFQVYPYLDPREQLPAPAGGVATFRDRFNLHDRSYILSVSRHDPVKRQDLLLHAFARLRREFPELRLVLAGGRSFSTGLHALREPDKAETWQRHLAAEIRRLKLRDAVVLTGTLDPEELRAAYDGASVFAHPAPWEGFGLVAVEAWMHRVPIVVSRGAGVAELVNPGVNGFLAAPGSVSELTGRLRETLRRPELAVRMGESGAMTARQCHVDVAAPRLKEIFSHTIRLYSRTGLGPHG